MSRLFGWIGATDSSWRSEKQIAADDSAWGVGAWLRRTVSGRRVGPETALQLSSYWGCIRNISEDVGKLPLVTFKRLDPRGKDRAPEHPSYRMLKSRANSEMSSMSARETLTSWAMGWGRGPAEIVRDGAGFAREYWPIHPSRIVQKREDGALYYDVSTDDLMGQSAALRKTPMRLRAEDVLYIHGLGDGWDGYSIAQLAAESIGTGLAAELQAASYFGNGVQLSGVLEHPGKLGDKALKNLRESLIAPHQDASSKWDVLIAEEGMKFKDAPRISPREAQMIEGRQFQVVDVARWFRMPPHKIQELGQATNNNIEHQGIEFVTDTLLPWLVRWEQELEAKVFLGDSDHFAEHNTSMLLRGDSKSRAEFYARAITTGWMSPDDVRELENMNPIPGGHGSKYYMQGAMAPLDLIATGQNFKSAATPSQSAQIAAIPETNATEAFAAVIGRNGSVHQ